MNRPANIGDQPGMPSDSGPADASGADAVSIKAMDDRGAIIGFHLLVFMVIVVGLATVVCLSQDWIGGVVIFNYSASALCRC